MSLKRSSVTGDTNYRGSSLDDIRTHMISWIESTDETITCLLKCQRKVLENQDKLTRPDEIDQFIVTIASEFERFADDFGRVAKGLEESVEERTVVLVKAIYSRSRELDALCRDFKHEYINCDLKDEKLRPLIDTIYEKARGQVLDYGDLLGVVGRLKTFVETKIDSPHSITIDDLEVFHLKPNLFGLGVNFNYFIKRLTLWYNGRKKN